MPEGPEVRRTTDFLNEFSGKKFSSFAVLSGRYAKKGGVPNTDYAVLPAVIDSVDCKGKFIYFNISYENTNKTRSNYYIFNTLGMTGMWSRNKTKHSRFAIFFDDGEILYYNDIRSFGTLKFVNDEKVLNKKLKSLGPDILKQDVDWQGFRQRFIRKPNKTIAECLMNQSVVSGVGNYLKAEILYQSKVSPNRTISEISKDEWIDLYYNTMTISSRSYKLGGATIANYRQPNGEEGMYSRRFAVYNQIECPQGYKVIREQTEDKRTTHWVPEIQR